MSLLPAASTLLGAERLSYEGKLVEIEDSTSTGRTHPHGEPLGSPAAQGEVRWDWFRRDNERRPVS